MTESTTPGSASATPEGVRAFIEDLDRWRAKPRLTGEHIVYVVKPGEGLFAGEWVETAVETAELANWPDEPPHWIHLPREVTFTVTHSRHSSIAGWVKHSRRFPGWGEHIDPIAGWLAHVRTLVAEAR